MHNRNQSQQGAGEPRRARGQGQLAWRLLRRLWLLPIALILLALGTSRLDGALPRLPELAPSVASAAEQREATVVRVADGDTIAVMLAGERITIRLVGIDTPETKHPSRPVECYGKEAAGYLADLLPPGTVVRVATDPLLDTSDRYGRLLALVWKGDLLVNRRLVSHGYAVVYTYQGVRGTYTGVLERAEKRARAAQRGLWAVDTCAGNPDLPVSR